MAQTAGYSGKPLFQKIGAKPGMHLLHIDAPETYPALMDGAETRLEAATRDALPDTRFAIVHFFARRRAALETGYEAAMKCVETGGMFWVSWPKKSSKLFEDLTEDGLRDVLLPTGWVDVKVCAVDADWSGLKFLRRTASK